MLSEAAEVMTKTHRRVQDGGAGPAAAGNSVATPLDEMDDEAIEDAIMNDTFLHVPSTEQGASACSICACVPCADFVLLTSVLPVRAEQRVLSTRTPAERPDRRQLVSHVNSCVSCR